MCVPSTYSIWTYIQARFLGGPSELGWVSNATTVGCGSALTWFAIGPDPEPAEVGWIQMNPQGCWPVNLTRDQVYGIQTAPNKAIADGLTDTEQ